MPPDEWLVSRVCEEFSCLPSQALREIDHDDGLLFKVMELRGLANAHAALEHAAKTGQSVKTTPLMGKVMRLQIEIANAR